MLTNFNIFYILVFCYIKTVAVIPCGVLISMDLFACDIFMKL